MSHAVVAELEGLLDCPVCYGPIGTRAYQCPAGHLVCFSCASGLTHCATCRRPMPAMGVRCLVFERMASLLPPRPCPNPGCGALVGIADAERHAATCEHRRCICPLCAWEGNATELREHLGRAHAAEAAEVSRRGGGGAAQAIVHLTNPGGHRYEFGWRGLVRVTDPEGGGDEWFVLHARTVAARTSARSHGMFLVFFCQGAMPLARDWTARVSVRGAEESRDREEHATTAPCWSACDEPESIARSRDALRLEIDHALRMSGASQRLYEEDMLGLAVDPAQLSLRLTYELIPPSSSPRAERDGAREVAIRAESQSIAAPRPMMQATVANELMHHAV